MTNVLTECVDGRFRITLNRPQKRNALDTKAVAQFSEALDAIDQHERPRVVLIEGIGPAFCAGRDLADPAFEQMAPGDALREYFNPLVERILGLSVPTVAAVRGPALGAGLGIALACDVMVVSENARFGSPFGRLGGVLDCGGHVLLHERIGPALTRDLILTGRLLDGHEAVAAGIATRCVADDILAETAEQIANQIGHGPTAAFAQSKAILRALSPLVHEVLELEACAQDAVADTDDVAEGLAAFRERRDPTFEGR